MDQAGDLSATPSGTDPLLSPALPLPLSAFNHSAYSALEREHSNPQTLLFENVPYLLSSILLMCLFKATGFQ